MGIISMQQNLTCPWLQCAHIRHTNMHWYTENVCCFVVPITHILIFQYKNFIGIITTYLLQYVFIFIAYFDVLRYMEDAHWTKRKFVVCVYNIRILCTLKTIHQKRACHDGDIYCWFSHKFLYYRYKNLSFHTPHVRILGTNHCGNTRHEAFKCHISCQDVLCRSDYD